MLSYKANGTSRTGSLLTRLVGCQVSAFLRNVEMDGLTLHRKSLHIYPTQHLTPLLSFSVAV
jgi:hypothetical protein